MVGSLKALDPNRPIREADMPRILVAHPSDAWPEAGTHAAVAHCPAVTRSRAASATSQDQTLGATFFYWMTWVALLNTAEGTVTPISRAVFKLMTISCFLIDSIGSSPDLAPFRILSTYVAVRRVASENPVP